MHPSTPKQLAFHGCMVTLLGLCAGIGFSYAAATVDVSDALYKNWKFAHVEGILNGFMVLIIASLWHQFERESWLLAVGKWTMVIGAYCNAIGPWITALFIGHRVIQPYTPLETFVVYGFYIPGVLPLMSFAIFAWGFWRAGKRE